MIFFIDFSSIGDSSFGINYWSKNLRYRNDLKFLIIKSGVKFQFSNHEISVPHSVFGIKSLDNIYRFILQILLLQIPLIAKIIKSKSTIIFNLHQPFKFWLMLKIFRSDRTKLICILHDIIEFDTSYYPNWLISNNKNILSICDEVILYSGLDLFNKSYPKFRGKVHLLPFPKREKYEPKNRIIHNRYSLLPGRYRHEKGFDFVIENYPDDINFLPLVIATPLPPLLEKKAMQKKNILLMKHLSSDEDFSNLLYHCEVVILYYHEGTNSGILETAITNRKKVIVSQISMFQTHKHSKHFIKINGSDEFVRELYRLSFYQNNLVDYGYNVDRNHANSDYQEFLDQLQC